MPSIQEVEDDFSDPDDVLLEAPVAPVPVAGAPIRRTVPSSSSLPLVPDATRTKK